MAKKCKIAKDKRGAKLIEKFADKRQALVSQLKDEEATLEDRLAVYKKLARMPRDSAKVRLRNRCERTGRPRGYYRKFKVCRVILRDLALEGKLPGVTKSSW